MELHLEPSSVLSARQGQALYHAALDRCVKTTAKYMGTDPRNVKQYRAAVLRKMGATRMTGAIAEAFKRGNLKYLPGFALCLLATLFSLAPSPASADDQQVLVRRSRRLSTRNLKTLPFAADPETVDLSRPHDLLWDGALYVVYL